MLTLSWRLWQPSWKSRFTGAQQFAWNISCYKISHQSNISIDLNPFMLSNVIWGWYFISFKILWIPKWLDLYVIQMACFLVNKPKFVLLNLNTVSSTKFHFISLKNQFLFCDTFSTQYSLFHASFFAIWSTFTPLLINTVPFLS